MDKNRDDFVSFFDKKDQIKSDCPIGLDPSNMSNQIEKDKLTDGFREKKAVSGTEFRADS